MMGRLNHDQEQFFYSFRLDEAVPNDHPVREVAAVLMLLRRKTILWPAIPCCNLKIDIRLVLISGDAMRRRDFSVQVCQLINAPNSCSITSPAVARTGFDRHSPRNYAFGK
jgi:hypothetical protein